MRGRLVLGTLLLTTILAGCGAGSGATRQVLVDYQDDRFSGVFTAYFPSTITVRPGDTVHFRQAWNGEPHSVTMGTLVNTAMKEATPLLPQLFSEQGQGLMERIFAKLPFMTGFNTPTVNQSAAQPCFLDAGAPPLDPNTRCARRPQPAFNGRQSYYSSGFIPYAGNGGNTFNVTLAKDIAPGAYQYYCAFHGPFMTGTIVVKPKGASIPSSAEVDKEALAQINTRAKPAAEALRVATTGKFDLFKAAAAAHLDPLPDAVASRLAGDYFAGYALQGPQAGPEQFLSINEFLPRAIRTRVGQKVTWVLIGNHTVTFTVPRYFPQLVIGPGGTVRFDHRADQPAGGAGFPQILPAHPDNPFIVDGGTWNGQGLRSSGVAPNNSTNQVLGFTLAFARPGTYQYACLIHPRMVGTVVVTR